jgi:hypothetical protein
VWEGPPPGRPDGDALAEAEALALGDADGEGHASPFFRIFDHGKRP